MADIHFDSADLPPREPIEYAEIPLRRPFLFIVPIFLGLAICLATYTLAPRQYRSATLIQIEADRIPAALLNKQIIEPAGGKRLRGRLNQEVLSRTRIDVVLKEFDPYPELSGRLTASEIAERMRDRIEIRVRDEQAFYIEFVHRSPYLAMAVTNRLATLFIDQSNQARDMVLSGALQFMDAQLDQARRDLEEREAAIQALRIKYLGALPEELQPNMNELQRLQTEKLTVTESLRRIEDRQVVIARELSDLGTRVDPSAGTPVITSSGIQTELQKLRAELASLRDRYTDSYPETRRLLRRIERLEAAQTADPGRDPNAPRVAQSDPVAAQLIAAQEQARLEGLALARKGAQIEQRIKLVEERVAQTPKVDAELRAVSRDYDKLKESYQSVLSKKMDTEMAQKLEKQWQGGRYRMLDPAFLPDRPDSPLLAAYLGAGLGIGLLTGLGATLVAEFLDHSVKNPREMQAILPFPHLVTVPHVASVFRGFRSALRHGVGLH